MKSSKHIVLLLLFGCIPGIGLWAQSLSLKEKGDQLHVAAPQLHFLTGKAVEKLRNGSTITYVVTLAATPKHARKAAFLVQEKFSVSFDIWEEKYSVAQNKPGGRTASRLTSAMVEEWCLDNIPIPVRSVPDRQPFMVRLECFVEENESYENGENRSGLTLAGLIDVFSRKKQEEPLRWEAVGGPFLLDALRSAKSTR
jgi:hypothetical protein